MHPDSKKWFFTLHTGEQSIPHEALSGQVASPTGPYLPMISLPISYGANRTDFLCVPQESVRCGGVIERHLDFLITFQESIDLF